MDEARECSGVSGIFKVVAHHVMEGGAGIWAYFQVGKDANDKIQQDGCSLPVIGWHIRFLERRSWLPKDRAAREEDAQSGVSELAARMDDVSTN